MDKKAAKEKTQIYLSKKISRGQAGFSLLEILVALTLGAMLYGLFATSANDSRDHLDQVMNNLKRAIRFSVDEAALRNSIIRVHFELDKEPQNWNVEYGPDSQFVLPNKKIESRSKLGERAKEELEAEFKELNKKFNPVTEFNDGLREISPLVRILGIGSALSDEFITEFEHSLYIYPTGEKDNGIIILATDEEVASLTINPFTLELETQYRPLKLEGNTIEQIEGQKYEIAKDMFESWKQK
jgi:prepilin-type N-terminal cleavage/methylation domain-containing protein